MYFHASTSISKSWTSIQTSSQCSKPHHSITTPPGKTGLKHQTSESHNLPFHHYGGKATLGFPSPRASMDVDACACEACHPPSKQGLSHRFKAMLRICFFPVDKLSQLRFLLHCFLTFAISKLFFPFPCFYEKHLSQKASQKAKRPKP